MTATRTWRNDLQRLTPLSLPLLPCGAGPEGKAPIDPATSELMKGWPTASFSVEAITAMNGVVRSVGTRTGAGLICFDLDGGTAIELALEHGCDPTTSPTWQVHRTTDPLRLKVLFRLTPEQEAELGEVTAKAHTKPPQDGAKGEAVEVFHHPGRQILLLGEHPPSGGEYIWPEDLGPEALALIPPQWWGLAVQVAAGSLGINTKAGNDIKPRSSSGKGEWRSLYDCPICGRDTTGYCSQHRTDGTIRCFHGSTFSPELRHGILRKGQTITGDDGITYGYCSTGPQSNGDLFSTFVVDKPRDPKDRPEPPTTDREELTPHRGAVDPEPSPKEKGFKPRSGSTAKWGQRKLGHTKAMACFDRCIEVLAKRERNSLTRRARLLKALHDLGLSKCINRQEISQRVLEAKDALMGNGYAPLTAADRAVMEQPEVRWVLPNLLPENDLTIVGGRPKVGKTRLAIAMVAAVLNRTDCLGFPAPEQTRPVVLVSDDQSDADTAQMLKAAGIWLHPQLIWSRHFRLTERDINALLETINANPGALVVMDSLRSVSRALQYGENDPEIGAILYDLKASVMDPGGSLLLIHHCNKAPDLVGVEALSGHSAIPGAANTVITLHYLTDDRGRPRKDIHERRVVMEGRSGEGFDLVTTRSGQGGLQPISTYAEHLQRQEQAVDEAGKLRKLNKEQLRVLDALQEATEPQTLQEVCKAIGMAWEGGATKEAKRIRKHLDRLQEWDFADSFKDGKEVFYCPASCEAQIKKEHREHRERSVVARDPSDSEKREHGEHEGNVKSLEKPLEINVPHVPSHSLPIEKSKTRTTTERSPRSPRSGPQLTPYEIGAPVELLTKGSWQPGYVIKTSPDADGRVKVGRPGRGRPAHVRPANLRPAQEAA